MLKGKIYTYILTILSSSSQKIFLYIQQQNNFERYIILIIANISCIQLIIKITETPGYCFENSSSLNSSVCKEIAETFNMLGSIMFPGHKLLYMFHTDF